MIENTHLKITFIDFNTADPSQPQPNEEPADVAILDTYSRAVIGAVETVGPSVVHIAAEYRKGKAPAGNRGGGPGPAW